MPDTMINANMNQLDVFFGDFSDAIAKIYVRAAGPQFAGATLSGVVRGPACEFAKTLMYDATLVSLGEGDSLLSVATLPDPCPWTPELPMLYEVSVQVADEQGNVIVEGKHSLGLRPLGARGSDLFLSGRRTVIRGVCDSSLDESRQADAESVDSWRDASAAMYVCNPTDGLCAAASRRGVLLIAAIEADEDLETRLRRLARWPAVAIVALRADALTTDTDVDKALRQAAPNLLFAERREAGCAADGGEHRVASWADMVIYEGDFTEKGAADIGAMKPDREVPVLAIRSEANRFTSVAEARVACDALQRDLAPHGDFAGYIV